MADIGQISNGESGGSVRSKLNLSIDESNKVLNGTLTRTGSTLVFDSIFGAIYNAAAPSSSASVTLDNTGALIGSVVAFYNDGTIEPTITPTPNPSAGTWVSGQVNVYWFMWDGTNFTQNIQTAPTLPTLTAPTFTLVSGAAAQSLDFSSVIYDVNAVTSTMEISTAVDGTYYTVAEYTNGDTSGTILQINGVNLSASTTYYVRMQSTAPDYQNSAYTNENAVSSATPTLSTPTLAISTGAPTELDYLISNEDAAATGAVFEISDDATFATGTEAVTGWTYNTLSGTVTTYNSLPLVNGTTYYFRYKNTASGYNDSAYATDSATPIASDIIFQDDFAGTGAIDPLKWTVVTGTDATYSQNDALVLTENITGVPTDRPTMGSVDSWNPTNYSDLLIFSFTLEAGVGGNREGSRSIQVMDVISPTDDRAVVTGDASLALNTFYQVIQGGSILKNVNVAEYLEGTFRMRYDAGTVYVDKWDGVSSWVLKTSDSYTNKDYFFSIRLAPTGTYTTGNTYLLKDVFVSKANFSTQYPT